MRLSRVLSQLFGSKPARTSSGAGEATDSQHFLIAFDPKAQALIGLYGFVADEEAEAALIEAEWKYRDTGVQVISFQAASIDDLKRTHPHYFEEGRAGVAPFPLAEV